MRLILLLIITLFIVGTMDSHDAERDYDYYRAMVCMGAWPDYKNTHPQC